MKRSVIAAVMALALLIAFLAPVSPGLAQDWAVYFSPRGGATEAIVREIGQAKDSILVQAYSFTSWPIAQALGEAQARGIRVKAILDKGRVHERYSLLNYLAAAGISVWIDAAHRVAHNKVMIIDQATVITGSFNFTRGAETENAENLLIIHDQALARRYVDNWASHLSHAQPFSVPAPETREGLP